MTDSPAGIAVDSSGDAYVTGYTESSDFPTANALQGGYTGGDLRIESLPGCLRHRSECGRIVFGVLHLSRGERRETAEMVSCWMATPTRTSWGQRPLSDFPAIALAYQGESGNATGAGNAFVSMVSHNNLPGVALTPQKLAFGNVSENTTSAVTSENVPATVTLMNAGTVPLQVASVGTSGDFAETDNCVGTIPAGGGRCTINVTFTPTVLAAEIQQLTIKDNAAGSPHLVTLTGTGVTGATTVLFSPTSLLFGALTLNTTSAPQTVTMINNGDTPLTVTNITTTGDFSETNNCPATPFTLPVNGSCTFQITFTPTSTGIRTGTLNVTDNVDKRGIEYYFDGDWKPCL